MSGADFRLTRLVSVSNVWCSVQNKLLSSSPPNALLLDCALSLWRCLNARAAFMFTPDRTHIAAVAMALLSGAPETKRSALAGRSEGAAEAAVMCLLLTFYSQQRM